MSRTSSQTPAGAAGRAAGVTAAGYVLRHHGGDRSILRDLLYALGVLPDPDVARGRPRPRRRPVGSSRRTLRPWAASPSTTVPSDYIADPGDRVAWMLANAREYVRPAAPSRRTAA